MWYNYSRTGMCCTVCVSVSVCELVPCSCSVTLPSFLLFSNPSCMGQHMERESIWAPSPAYLLDTQVGTTHSSPLSSPPAPLFVPFFINHVNWVRSVCVTWPDHHPGTLFTCGRCCPCCPVFLLCVVSPFWVRVLDLFAEFVCRLPYHTSCCGCVKWGCQWIFVCFFVGFLYCFLFFGWMCGAIQTKP